MTSLGDPARDKLSPHLQQLRAELRRSHDQQQQRALIKEIEQVGSTGSVIVLTERLFDTWGMGALKRTINGLVRLYDVGGLLALTITLPLDIRFYFEKLNALAKGIRLAGHKDISEQVQRLASQQGRFDNLSSVGRSTLTALSLLPFRDVATGATIARVVLTNGEFTQYMGVSNDWLGNTEPANLHHVYEALEYAEQRIPGISSLLIGDSV
jgi:hypothetical protein